MANETVTQSLPATQTFGLSQTERVVDIFISPSKTFADVLRSANWLVPFILLVIVTLAVSTVIDKRVGYTRAAENQIRQSPKQEQAMSQLTPEQREQAMQRTATVYRYSSYASPVLILVFSALAALVLWASFNFGLGASTTYSQVLAVMMYASLPKLLLGLLTIVTLFAGGDPESYDMKNPVGTNIGFYVPDAATWLKSMLSWFDVIGIWSLALLVIGMAIIARKTVAQSAAVVVGWWVVGLVVSVGLAAAFS